MHLRIRSQTGRLAVVECTGRFSSGDLVRCLRIICERTIPPRVLCDMRRMEFDSPSNKVVAAAQTYANSGGSLPSKIAFLVGDPLPFGLLRMFVAFLGPSSEQGSVFTGETEALAWLLPEDDERYSASGFATQHHHPGGGSVC